MNDNDQQIIDDLVATMPQANAEFQRQLEDRLMLELYTEENGRKNEMIHTKTAPVRPLSKLPLTLAAAVLAVILVSSVLVFRSTPSAQPILGAQATDTLISFESAFQYGGQVIDPRSEGTLSAMQRAGMTWMKYQMTYSESADEPEKIIDAVHDANFKVLLQVQGDPARLNQADYVNNYVKWLADAALVGADAIEVWSEPNLDRNWMKDEIGGAAYVDLLRQAYEAIKIANPNTLVISAAPAPTGAEAAFPGQVMNDDRWLREVVESGGLQYMDCVGAQYVEGVIPPGKTSGDPRDDYYTRYFGGMVLAYQEIINDQKPLCFTSLGYLSDDGLPALPAPFAWAENITVGQQAAWLGEAVRLASMSGKVQLIIVWNVDFTQYDDAPFAGYAMIRPDGSCPACDALEVFSVDSNLFPPTNLQPVVVARYDLAAGTQINEDMLTTVYWPPSSIPEESISDARDFIGQYLSQEITRWQPILKNQLSTVTRPLQYQNGSGLIPMGWVGIIVPNQQIQFNPLLERGDKVDIVGNFLFVDIDEDAQSAATIAVTQEPRLVEQNVIQGAGVLRLPYSNEIDSGAYMITVSPEDAVILNWLIASRIPLELVQTPD